MRRPPPTPQYWAMTANKRGAQSEPDGALAEDTYRIQR